MSLRTPLPAGTMADQVPWIIEATDDSFERDVLERSAQLPVVVDFWAPWCGPCRALAPLLEQLAAEHAGRFLLAKVNVDECPLLASEFRVQSIPHVVAIRDRQLVDGFLGALPEKSLREWLARILPSEADRLVEEGRALAATDPDEAARRFRQALQHDPAHAGAKTFLARLLLQQERLEEAAALIDELEQRGYLEPEAQRLKADLELQRRAAATGGLAAARQACLEDPGNLAKRLQLAEALAAEREHREALDVCLDVIARDRGEWRGQARDVAVRILNLTDVDPELVADYRRKLASALY